MNDFNKKIDHSDSHIEGWIGVNPIEKDKKGKEEFPKETKKSNERSLLFATIILYFKKVLTLFARREKIEIALATNQQLVDDLSALKKLLHILAHEDQSHNPEFTEHLTELWHSLQENNISYQARLPLPELCELIQRINLYPPSEEHSLGYYLTEYAGKQWLPFPFMDILHQLHQQYQENPESSELFSWMNLIEKISISLV